MKRKWSISSAWKIEMLFCNLLLNWTICYIKGSFSLSNCLDAVVDRILLETWGNLMLGSWWVALVVKTLPTYAGDMREKDSIPGSGRPPGKGHGNLLQYSWQENPRDRGAWWATVHRVAQSNTTEVTSHAHMQRKHRDTNLCH